MKLSLFMTVAADPGAGGIGPPGGGPCRRSSRRPPPGGTSQRGCGGREHGAGFLPQRGDRDDADDGDQGEHQAVLDHRGALFTAGELPGGGDELGHGWAFRLLWINRELLGDRVALTNREAEGGRP